MGIQEKESQKNSKIFPNENSPFNNKIEEYSAANAESLHIGMTKYIEIFGASPVHP